MTSFSLRSLVAMALIGLLCSSTAIAQQNTLRWKLEEGQKFKVEVSQNQSQKMNSPQGEFEIPVEQVIHMTWEVTGVEGDVFSIVQKMTRMKMSMDSPFMQMEYDTDEGEAEGMAEQIAAAIDPMIGAAVAFKMNGRGEISDVEVPEDVVEEMQAAGGGMGGQMFSADMLEQMISQSGIVFPEGAVDAGAEWENTTTQKNPMMNMTINSKYKYAGEEDKGGTMIQKIAVSAKVELEAGETPLGGSVEIDEQESNGEIWFDNAAGYMTGSKSTQEMVMIMEMMGQEMDIESKTEVEVKVTKVDG